MSYRECRTLCEMLRALNYSRIVSLENFAKPNFELVADMLYFLAQKYDPQSQISDDINEEKDRVEFMRGVVALFAGKARIKLNGKKLYYADGEAVPQLLKVASILYKAGHFKPIEEEEAAQLALPAKVANLKSQKALAGQICELGARLYDAMSKQPALKRIRTQALNFLQGLSGDDSTHIEKCISTIIQQQEANTAEMNKYVVTMEQEQKVLQDKLKKKAAQLTRNEKRLRDLLVVKPAFMEEYERLEEELGRLHEVYVNKFRNIDYLEHELEKYNKAEEDKLRRAKLKLEQMQKEAVIREKNDLLNVDELDEGIMEPAEERSFTRGNQRNQHAQQKLEEEDGEEEEEQSGEDIDDEDDDDDDDSDF